MKLTLDDYIKEVSNDLDLSAEQYAALQIAFNNAAKDAYNCGLQEAAGYVLVNKEVIYEDILNLRK